MDKHIRNIRFLTKLLDSQFHIGPFKFGLDPLLGLIPWGGDLISFGLSLYILWIAWKVKISTKNLFTMIGNIVIDLIISSFPWVGDFVDFFFKANERNWKILLQHIGEEPLTGEVVS